MLLILMLINVMALKQRFDTYQAKLNHTIEFRAPYSKRVMIDINYLVEITKVLIEAKST